MSLRTTERHRRDGSEELPVNHLRDVVTTQQEPSSESVKRAMLSSSNRHPGLLILFTACFTLYNTPSTSTITSQRDIYNEMLSFAPPSIFTSSSLSSSHSHTGHRNLRAVDQTPKGLQGFNFSTTYEPAQIETWLIGPEKGGRKFHFDSKSQERDLMADGCEMYNDSTATPFYDQLQHFRSELRDYARILDAFLNDDNATSTVKPPPPVDLREQIEADGGSYDICSTLELHPLGLPGIFEKSGMLSKVPNGGGYVEPLITPMRHLEHCYAEDPMKSPFIMDMHFLIHDFASLCRKLKPTSKTVFIDMGAALDFHDGSNLVPAVYVTDVYQKFGFKFDHIYAYEVNQQEPSDVYQRIPDDLKAAYHWYNVGVNASLTSSNNPLKLLMDNFNEDDFVVVKLDIDTHSIEQPMVELLLTDDRLQSLVDCFYFEHHVHLKELAPYWMETMGGSVEDSLQLFTTLREKGIAAHYWP